MSRTASTTEALIEFVTNPAGASLNVDETTGVIRGVKIIGNVSKNGREYPQATLTRAKSMYEGRKVYLNHPAKPGEPRDVRDGFGNIRDVREASDGLYGDLHFNPKHADAAQICWEAKNNPANLGLSHNANGRVVKSGGKVVVEEITAVASVDLVADPATTRGLFEQHDKGQKDMELAEALEKVAALTTDKAALETKVSQLTEQVGKLTGEKTALQEQVDAAAAATKAAEHKTKVGELLSEHKIPEKTRTKEFVSLLESATLENATAAVKSLAETLKSAGTGTTRSVSGTPISESQKTEGGDKFDAKSFAAGLKGR